MNLIAGARFPCTVVEVDVVVVTVVYADFVAPVMSPQAVPSVAQRRHCLHR